MRRLTKSPVLLAAILSLGFLAAGCGHSGAGGAIASLTPSRSISVPSRSAGLSPSATIPATGAGQPSATQNATAPAPTAESSSSPVPGTGSSSSLIWLWVVIGAVVLIGIIVVVARSSGRRSGRRSAVASGWRSRVIDAYAKGSAVYDAMSVAETPAALAAADAAARWSEIQRRADDLAQTLYALREAAPADDDRARVTDVLHWLQAVRSGMAAERSPGGASERQAEVVRSRLLSFEAALRALRAPGDRLP